MNRVLNTTKRRLIDFLQSQSHFKCLMSVILTAFHIQSYFGQNQPSNTAGSIKCSTKTACKRFPRAIIAFRCIPKSKLQEKRTFMPKQGQITYNAKSFRTISPTNYLSKEPRKQINYIRTVPFIRFLLHTQQHAYRRGKSTETALHQTTCRIEKSLAHKELTLYAHLVIYRVEN